MRAFITYDDTGRIKAIGVAHGEHADRMGVQPPPGHNVVQVDLNDVEHPRHLERYQREFHIDVSSGKPTLRKK